MVSKLILIVIGRVTPWLKGAADDLHVHVKGLEIVIKFKMYCTLGACRSRPPR
jgi:hypothetical protein